jgi:hypothetical protein
MYIIQVVKVPNVSSMDIKDSVPLSRQLCGRHLLRVCFRAALLGTVSVGKGMSVSGGSIGAGPPVLIHNRGRRVRGGTTGGSSVLVNASDGIILNMDEGTGGGDEITRGGSSLGGSCIGERADSRLDPLTKPALKLSGIEATRGWPARVRAARISGVMLMLREDHCE